MNPAIRKDGTLGALCAFYGKDFQPYAPGKVYAPFRSGKYCCTNPVIIGYIKTGRLAWQEQWIEVARLADTGKYGYGFNTCTDSCQGSAVVFSRSGCYCRLPHPNYGKLYRYDSVEDAIRAAITDIEAQLEKRPAQADKEHKGTRKMLQLAKEQLRPKQPEIIQLTLF